MKGLTLNMFHITFSEDRQFQIRLIYFAIWHTIKANFSKAAWYAYLSPEIEMVFALF